MSQTVGQPGVTIEEVIVTGSNIPTAEEVTPQPVYLLNRDLIFQFGVRSATDLVQKLTTVSGISINENVNNNGDGHVDLITGGQFAAGMRRLEIDENVMQQNTACIVPGNEVNDIDQTLDRDDQSCFFPDLPQDCIGDPFAPFELASRDAPLAGAGRQSTPDENHFSTIVGDYCADADHRRVSMFHQHCP